MRTAYLASLAAVALAWTPGCRPAQDETARAVPTEMGAAAPSPVDAGTAMGGRGQAGSAGTNPTASPSGAGTDSNPGSGNRRGASGQNPSANAAGGAARTSDPAPGATSRPQANAGQDENRGERGRGQAAGMGNRMGALGLLRMDEVLAEIKVTEAQKKKLEAMVQEQMAAFRGGQGTTPDPQEIAKRMEQAQKAVADILDPAQEKRLQELMLQRMGTGALADEKVQADLGMTPAQVQQLKKIGDELQAEMRKAMEAARPAEGDGPQAGSPRPDMSRFREMRDAANKKMEAVLTPAQRAKLEAMKGKPFAFPQRQRGGGGGQATTR
jgi:Spy/CpxP family protein refolding chaperone